MNTELAGFDWTGLHITPWKLIGLTGALMFGARWFVQFAASYRAGVPTIPRVFWIMSLVGSVMTLSYFLFSAKQDAVGVLQNLFPMFTAAYSLYLDLRPRGSRRAVRTRDVPVEAPSAGIR
jgi:lipid-A-disaccharide synthase-like uncharacterized protein